MTDTDDTYEYDDEDDYWDGSLDCGCCSCCGCSCYDDDDYYEDEDDLMEDRDFLDTLYKTWSQTTRVADTYWIVEYDEGSYEDVMEHWTVWAVPEEGERIFIGDFEREEDADFTASMHGCLSDLVRRMHSALDEADRLDEARDEAENALASEILHNMELSEQLKQPVS